MKSYKFKLKPSPRITRTFEQWLNVCRELYNAGLQERRDAWAINQISINYHAQATQLPKIKEIRADFAQVNAQVLQDTLRRLSKTFDAFFRRIKSGERPGYPRFKSKYRFNLFTFPQAKSVFSIKGNRLYLSKIGHLKIIQHRPMEGEIKTCTIKREVDGWYAVFAVEENQSRFIPRTGDNVGIDVGIEFFATLSTGEQIENPRFLREAEQRLKTAQRKVSRRTKGSKRRRKAVRLLAKRHQKIARQRTDFHHKTALKIVREFDGIAVEDLNIAGMVKNRSLAKSIVDVAWSAFFLILASKAANAGRKVLRVAPQFTSQDCSQCGARVHKTLAVREHRCIACGFIADRDHNAAINIRQKAGGIGFGDGSGCAPARTENLPGYGREAAAL